MGDGHAGMKARLKEWFGRYSQVPTFEIEARVRDVSPAGFTHVVNKMQKNPQWSNNPAWSDSLDMIHASGVRETVDLATKRRTFIKKDRKEFFNTQLTAAGATHEVRFALAEERPMHQDSTPVQTWRYKRRITFVHKGLFSFELTQVKAVATPFLVPLARP